MKKESFILSFIAITIGIIVSGIVFYLYQSTKIIPENIIKPIAINPTTPIVSITEIVPLHIDLPKDEDVVDTKSITISGKTIPTATIIISKESEDIILNPTRLGTFSTLLTINDGVNEITITSVSPSGEETTIKRTITFSTESF